MGNINIQPKEHYFGYPVKCPDLTPCNTTVSMFL